uniref:Uncharacterized protein n=1 Tax=Anopheles dirus TaxID=7168 RepID=A0A182NFC1_9DIPT
MSKRAGYFQMKQPSFASKKPKLDIEIIPSQQYNPKPTSSNSNNGCNGVAAKPSVENLWDDDDDDIIVLATQAFEADITFGKFSRSVKSSTQATTEVITAGPGAGKPSEKVPDKLVAVLFADGDDDLFSEKLDDNYRNIDNAINEYFNNNDDDFNMLEFQQRDQNPWVGGTSEAKSEPAKPIVPVPEEEFKAPIPVPKPSVKNETPTSLSKDSYPAASSSSRVGMVFRAKTATAAASVQPQPPKMVPAAPPKPEPESMTKKQEHAKDIQVKFLTKHVEQLAKKVEMLQKDYNEAMEKTQVKDGEVSMLRYELKMVKGTNEQLRSEKIREKETIQKEWIEKMRNLEKTIATQKLENDFREMEIMNLRTKHLNASTRVMEVRECAERVPGVGSKNRAPDATEADSFILSELLPALSLSEPTLQEQSAEVLHFDPRVFLHPTDSGAKQEGKLRKHSRLTRNERAVDDQFVTLQTCLLQLLRDIATDAGGCSRLHLSAELFPLVAEATETGLNEIVLYCRRLAQQQDFEVRQGGGAVAARGTERSVQGRARSKMELTAPVNVFQQEPLFVGEQAIVIRRFLAMVGLYCRVSNELVVKRLLERGLVSRLAKDVRRFSSASFLISLHGMVTGAAALLNGLSFRPQRLKTYAEKGSDLMDLFRSIVLCQTDTPSSLVELSEFLRRLSQVNDASVQLLLNRLCTSHQPAEGHSTSKKSYRLKSISFSQETCTLQMYAALLESSIRQHVRYAGWQLKPLLKNAENTILFLRNVVRRPIGWIRSFHDKSDPNGCDLCHIRMVSAFLVLLYRVLLCWTQRTVLDADDESGMQRIAQNGVLLMYDLFQTAYRKKLLRVGGHALRYRLRVVYNWLKLYEKELDFRHVHSTTLKMLDMRLLMSDPLRSSLETDSQGEASGRGKHPGDGEATDSGGVLEEMFSDFVKNRFLLQPG